jgi:hypothetical protein
VKPTDPTGWTGVGIEYPQGYFQEWEKPYFEDGNYSEEFQDTIPNMRTIVIPITGINTQLNQPNITYSITECTNGSVKVTLTFSEPVTLEETDRTALPPGSVTALQREKTYFENTTDTVHYINQAGNQDSTEVVVNNIDTDLHHPEVAYSTTEWTNQNVVVTLTFDEEVTINTAGWTKNPQNPLQWSKTFTNNTDEAGETVNITDCANNQKDLTIIIENIDKELPTIDGVTHSPIESTTGPVTIIIEATDPESGIAGYALDG